MLLDLTSTSSTNRLHARRPRTRFAGISSSLENRMPHGHYSSPRKRMEAQRKPRSELRSQNPRRCKGRPCRRSLWIWNTVDVREKVEKEVMNASILLCKPGSSSVYVGCSKPLLIDLKSTSCTANNDLFRPHSGLYENHSVSWRSSLFDSFRRGPQLSCGLQCSILSSFGCMWADAMSN